MEIDAKHIEQIVREVVGRMEEQEDSCSPDLSDGSVFFDTMEEAVRAAGKSQKSLVSMSLSKRQDLICAMREASRREAESLAISAREETGMGRTEDKVLKNLLAADKTPGIEDLQPVAYSGDRGLTLVERAPYGVIGAVTPSTNPSSTVINNAISIIAAGNSVVFAPHPAASGVSKATISILSEAIVSAGGPRSLITAMKTPSLEGARVLFSHDDIKLLLVTGGPAVVRAAMESNKRVIAAGPGNPPVVIDDTAEPEKTVDSIIKGASFDNGVLCTSEKEVLMTEGASKNILKRMRADNRAYELTRDEMDRLAALVIKKSGRGGEPVIEREFIGRAASVIAEAIGVNVPADTRLLWGLVDEEHDFMWTEQLMPVLPFAVTGDIERTIDLAVSMEGGNGHTAVMHSLNVDNLTRMARRCACSIFVKNGASYMGLGMGEGYAALSIATPTGDGLVKALSFTRPLRCVLVDYFRIT
ncbi:MAG: aldehyde dehydrogenase family protein [Elusimicrobiota bacterium]